MGNIDCHEGHCGVHLFDERDRAQLVSRKEPTPKIAVFVNPEDYGTVMNLFGLGKLLPFVTVHFFAPDMCPACLGPTTE